MEAESVEASFSTTPYPSPTIDGEPSAGVAPRSDLAASRNPARNAPPPTPTVHANGFEAHTVAGQPWVSYAEAGNGAAPDGVTDGPLPRLAPEVTLYVNRSPESEQAFAALAEAHVVFRAVAAPRRRAPVAEFADSVFRGLTGVQDLVEVIREFKAVLIAETAKALPGFLETADPELKRRVEQSRVRQLEEARAVLAQVQQAMPRSATR